MQQRSLNLDLYRALGIVLMVLFHLTYDLDYFGLISVDMTGVPFLIHLRTFIVAIFMSAVGMSLYIVYAKKFDRQKYLRRQVMLGAAAVMVSVVTYLLFPDTWVYFGVLHMILIASVLGPPFTQIPNISGFLGIVFIVLYATDLVTMHPLFVQLQPLLHLPAYHTEDLAPFIPWFGVVLLGIFIRHHGWLERLLLPRSERSIKLSWLGRHSLAIYLLHQPILFLLLMSGSKLLAK